MNSPWIIRLEQEIEDFEKIIEKNLKSEFKLINKLPIVNILARAISQKEYDIYHSTTIEGYTITPQEVEAVLLGSKPEEKESFEKLRNKMAIIGHSHAFEYITDRIKSDFNKTKITDELLSETYFRLFKPSVDAKIIDRYDLLQFRKVKVYIRNSRFVPPSFEKVSDLMECFITSINNIKNNFIKAILAHYFLVTIHPYTDGNGRCGRLLMNYILCTSGYNWITINRDMRDKYFTSLQEGQLNSNIIPFAKFIISLLSSHKI